jgi:hypothetical protein
MVVPAIEIEAFDAGMGVDVGGPDPLIEVVGGIGVGAGSSSALPRAGENTLECSNWLAGNHHHQRGLCTLGCRG